MKNRIFKHWNFLRVFRLSMGILLTIQAVMAAEVWFAGLGILLVGTAVFNIGCCGPAGCEVTPRKVNTSKEPEYEEVK
ncbi:MAG: hypothetical protein MH137_06385 [Flavobacteriales bacterium]|nr:hypothetical protein [Flavobacteriales bacterium]